MLYKYEKSKCLLGVFGLNILPDFTWQVFVLFRSGSVMPHNTGPLWTVAVKALIYVELIETEMDKWT